MLFGLFPRSWGSRSPFVGGKSLAKNLKMLFRVEGGGWVGVSKFHKQFWKLCYKPYYDGEKNDVQWIEISGYQHSIDELDLIKWLRLYGEVVSPITEKQHPDSIEDCPVGNGTCTVKMNLKEHIPQFLPACGKKLGIQYLGINKSCFNCYVNHTRQRWAWTVLN